MGSIDETLAELLCCPQDGGRLSAAGPDFIACAAGHRYSVIGGIPVLLSEDLTPTLRAGAASLHLARTRQPSDAEAPELYLESVGISDAQREVVSRLWRSGRCAVDPVVQYLIGATCGIAYRGRLGALSTYPIPEIPLPPGRGEILLDLGCNWGRWSIAAARKGYRVIGIDPQLGAVLAGKRVAAQLGLDITFVCGDARRLPILRERVDRVFSYSVLQHFSEEDCRAALREINRILRPGGTAMIQMANSLGVRSAYHLARRGLRAPREFEVRYYMPGVLQTMFRSAIGNTTLAADCFLGLGLQPTDRELYSTVGRLAVTISEACKRAARWMPGLARLADSLYLVSVKDT